MKAFEQPIPHNPKEAGKTYEEDKKKVALEKWEQQQREEQTAQEAAFAPFDRPLSSEQKEEKTPLQKSLILLDGLNKNIEKLKEELNLRADDIKDRLVQTHKLKQLEELKGRLLSTIDPEELEEYLEPKLK